MRVLILVPLALSLGGCIAQTAASIVTLPVKVVSKTADVLTTSQSEADEKRGRAIRKQEERERFRRLDQPTPLALSLSKPVLSDAARGVEGGVLPGLWAEGRLRQAQPERIKGKRGRSGAAPAPLSFRGSK
jgi:hypothetical protein